EELLEAHRRVLDDDRPLLRNALPLDHLRTFQCRTPSLPIRRSSGLTPPRSAEHMDCIEGLPWPGARYRSPKNSSTTASIDDPAVGAGPRACEDSGAVFSAD